MKDNRRKAVDRMTMFSYDDDKERVRRLISSAQGGGAIAVTDDEDGKVKVTRSLSAAQSKSGKMKKESPDLFKR